MKWRVSAGVALALAFLVVAGCGDAEPGPAAQPGPQEQPGPAEQPGPGGDVGPGDEAETIAGSGTVVVESRDVAWFERIDLSGEGTVEVAIGGEPSLTIETDDNLMEYLEATVTGDTLTLRTVGEGAFDVEPTASVVWRVTAPAVVAVEVSGAGSIDVPKLSGDHLDVTVGGVGDITLPGLNLDTLAVVVDGVGTVAADGTAGSVDVKQNGTGTIDLGGLEAATAAVLIESISDVVIWATDRVDISGDGRGTISVYGSPEISGGGDRVTLLGQK